jgi:uncharacterized damage-inducible protein DinB
MYTEIKEFVGDWQLEAGLTLKIFAAIPDDKLSDKVHENVRELGLMAWHITQTITEMGSKGEIFKEDVLEKEPVPGTTKEICDAYKKYSELVVSEMNDNWTDDSLSEKVNMYGEMWEKRQMLKVLINHQIHHRAQMTVVMRLLDVRVPGIYGPAKEEWAQFGMEPAK